MPIRLNDESVKAPMASALERHLEKAQIDDGGTERERTRQTLLLNRTRALANLQFACSPAHRGQLEQTIADIDARLETER